MYNSAIDLPNTMAGDEKSHRELQRQRQERAPKKDEQGGRIIKGQDGFLNMWQKAYDSKLGKGVRNFMFGTDSDLSNEEYIKKHGYSKPIMGMPPAVKISYIPEGVYGSTRMAEQAAKAAKEAAKFKHVSPLDGGRFGHTIKDVSGVHLKNNGGKVEKAQWGGVTTGNERTNSNNRGQYWEDLTINPEFGRTYRLNIPGSLLNSTYIRHYSPNGTNKIKGVYSLPEDSWVKWSNLYVPGGKEYEWNDFFFNHMKKNVPQRLSNAQRLVPPMYDVEK